MADEIQYPAFHDKGDCEYIKGNVTEFEINECDCEIRADVVVKIVKGVRIWGQVISCDGFPVEGALVKLVKVIFKDCKPKLKGVAHTVTDCKGFYQFEVDKDDCAKYKIIVSKAAKGKEREVCGYGECYPCCPKADDDEE